MLLACCLRLEYWLKVDSKSRHFVAAVGINIKLEPAFAIDFDSEHVPRPAAKSLIVVRHSHCPALHHDHVPCVHKKWRHVAMNIPVEQELEEGARHVVKIDPLCYFRRTFLSWILARSWKVCACRSLLRRRLRSWSYRYYGRGESCCGFPSSLWWRSGEDLRRTPVALPMFGWIIIVHTAGISRGRQGDVCARVITLRDFP